MFRDEDLADFLDRRDKTAVADKVYADAARDECPVSLFVTPEIQDAATLRERGEFIRHGVVCELDAELYRGVLDGELTMGAAVEWQISRDQEDAEAYSDQYNPGEFSQWLRRVRAQVRLLMANKAEPTNNQAEA